MKRNEAKGIGARVWFGIVFFGLVGQIAWVVENMNFATLAQDICTNAGNKPMGYVVTTLMVIFSAIAATVTTVFAGGWSDRLGKRKPFVAIGYILWGITILLFGLIPQRPALAALGRVAALLVVFDCVMTFAGSTANDAAFNAWVADNTETSNRGRVNAVLSVMPVFAVVIVMLGLGGLYRADAESNLLFFAVLGAIPAAAGLIALFALRDADTIRRAEEQRLADTFYGFLPQVIRSNRLLYVTLGAACIVGIAQQTFYSYLINFIKFTRGYGDGFAIPMAVIIVGAAAFTGAIGWAGDRFGRRRLLFPLLALSILGIAAFWLLQFMPDAAGAPVLYVGGVVMMGGLLSLTGLLSATFQDYIPKGYEGRFQGVRMCFTVLIPMIIGPIISLLIGLNTEQTSDPNFTPSYGIFLAAAIVAIFACAPLYFVRKDAQRLRDSLLQKADGQR